MKPKAINQYKKEKVTSPMAEVRMKARKTCDKATILYIAQTYKDELETCKQLLANKYLTEEAKAVLASSPNAEVRRLLAQQGETIESTKVQLRLAYDISGDRIVKEHLARTTTKEEIKEILFKSNPESQANLKIRGTCLRRMRNMEMIERFILVTSSNVLPKYYVYILRNPELSRHVLNIFLAVCHGLSDVHIRMIKEQACYDERFVTIR